MNNIDITDIINTLKSVYSNESISKQSSSKQNIPRDIEIDILNTLFEYSLPIKVGFPSDYFIMHSYKTILHEPYVDYITLITQFYISDNSERNKEILECLLKNANNLLITNIILVTEKDYNLKDIKLEDNPNNSKITFVNINKRMSYSDAFNIIDNNNLSGYVIISNSDIFFDETLNNIYKSGIHKEKSIYSQLRFEYSDTDLNKCELFGPRGDSQDSWFLHTNFNIGKEHRKLFTFMLGTLGCDNHINYLFSILGYKLYNDPYFLKSYHIHKSEYRTYNSNSKRCDKPWLRIAPNLYDNLENWVEPNHNVWRFNIIEENLSFKTYLDNKINNNINFIIPRIAGVENNFAFIGICLLQQQISHGQIEYIQKATYTMKNNAGIKLSSKNSIIKYARAYLEAFEMCDTYFEWEKWGNVYKYISDSHDFITENFKKQKRWAYTFDIFHNIFNNPWTHSFKGKRLLIVSPLIESMKEKLDILPEIYGVDLFPECKFVFIKPPQTQGDNESEEFDIELNKFMNNIKNIQDTFDIALCSCGGYGNLVCAEIYKLGKSAIYVGGVLQMYFGIYGNRWLRERPDILKLFMNKHWTRPKNHEKPAGYDKVEGSCYW